MKILVAIDGSSASKTCGDLVSRLFPDATAELTLATVVDALELVSGPHRGVEHGALEPMMDALRKDSRHVLDGEQKRLAERGWHLEPLLLEGDPAHELIEAATRIGTDLVVVGSRGRGRLEQILLGSVSRKVVTHAPCSVLVVREPVVAPLRILIAYDGSPSANAAVELVSKLPLPADTTIRLLQVLTLIKYYRMDIVQKMTASWQKQKQAAARDLDRVAQSLRERLPQTDVELVEQDSASHGILDAASSFAANLIVAGHKGHHALQRFLLGSVAEQVTHHAPCSVLLVRAQT